MQPKGDEQIKAKGDIVLDPKGNYSLVCRACSKPNAPTATFCTGCSFPTSPYDLQRMPDNIFLDLVNGKDIGAKVHYRDDQVLAFDDKFGVSEHHIDVIPTQVIQDITCLTREHIPLLQKLYQTGKQVFADRHPQILQALSASASASATSTSTTTTTITLDDIIQAGYNFPVSVKHLHLHMLLPPFKHEKVLQYPRWHTHQKVMADLEQYGHVRVFSEHPDSTMGNLVL